jgi:Rap1a immunity proteins
MWKKMMCTAAVLVALTGVTSTTALAWYDGALQQRDLMVDSALVFAYHKRCGARPIPADVRKRAEAGLNMAGPSFAAGKKRDVDALIKKLGLKKFCDEYRREMVAGENPIVTGGERPHPGGERPDPNPTGHIGQTGDDWAADCRVSDKNSSRYVSCLRFARGVADGFIIAQMFNEAANPPQLSFICVPKLATSDQIVEVGLRYWNTANSETRSLRASQLLAEAWLKTWPCGK